MSRYETQYKILLNNIMYNGRKEDSRAGMVRANFGMSLGVDLQDGFPILTGKKIFFDKAVAEFKWMWTGNTHTAFLERRGVTWWKDFADDNGECGPTYGHQVRNFGRSRHHDGVDQINKVVKAIQNNSRRAVLTFWNPTDEYTDPWIEPCYVSMTFVRQGDELHMDFHIRSSDTAVGLPYDMCIGALFLHEVASLTRLTPRLMRVNLSNAHIYENCMKGVEEYLARPIHALPKYDDFQKIFGYVCEPPIKMTLNV